MRIFAAGVAAGPMRGVHDSPFPLSGMRASPADQHAAAGGAADHRTLAGALAVHVGSFQAELFWLAALWMGGDGCGVELSVEFYGESDGGGRGRHADNASIPD